MPKICLDPGHAGVSYNTGGWGYYESKRMWDLHLLLKTELEKRGFQITTTRNSMTQDLDVYSRGYLSKNCDCFLSLHSNACGTESVDYSVVYRAYDNRNGADVLALKLAAEVGKLMGNKQAGKTAIRTGTAGGEYYGVMRGARAAGCPLYLLLEHSFHTNETASKWLLSDSNLSSLAVLEAEILASHFGLASGTAAATTTASPVTTTSQTGSNGVDYTVTTTVDKLNIRKGAGTGFAISGVIDEGAVKNVYTIVEEKDGWGRLKSGVGWVCLEYVKKR